MRIVSNVLFILCLLVFVVWLIVPVAITAAGYRLSSAELRAALSATRIWVVPLAVLLTLFKTYKRRDTAEQEGKKVGCTVATAIGLLPVLFMVWLGGNESDQILFYRKDNPQQQILIRDNGVGAYDSGPLSFSIYEREPVTSWLERFRGADTTGLDRSLWVRHR